MVKLEDKDKKLNNFNLIRKLFNLVKKIKVTIVRTLK